MKSLRLKKAGMNDKKTPALRRGGLGAISMVNSATAKRRD